MLYGWFWFCAALCDVLVLRMFVAASSRIDGNRGNVSDISLRPDVTVKGAGQCFIIFRKSFVTACRLQSAITSE